MTKQAGSGVNPAQTLAQRRARVLPKGVGNFHADPALPATVVRAQGAILQTADGKQLIDFAGGIGVMNIGHCDPAVVRAIQQQAEKLTHTCIHVASYEPYIELCEKLIELFPHHNPHADGPGTKCVLLNSGAEAVENAIKIARMHTKRQGVVCYSGAFHGRTLMALSLTSKTGYKPHCGPFAPEVYRLPYPNRYWYGDGLGEQAFVERELLRFRQMLINTIHPENIACVILEVVQGEGGFVVAPPAYLKGLRQMCDELGIVLIFDEVQSGFCRTGKWAAYQHFGVQPDLSTWAKSMGGGMPISAVIGRAEIMDAGSPGTIGGTYGGNPVSCAAAIATIQRMEELNLNDRATRVGQRITERFSALQRKHPKHIGDVRGLGAMVALELRGEKGLDGKTPHPVHAPAGDLAKKLARNCLERGLLLVTAGPFGDIIRVLCPLVITDQQLDQGLAIIEQEFEKLISKA